MHDRFFILMIVTITHDLEDNVASPKAGKIYRHCKGGGKV